jgi:hypothetical protein
MEVRAQLHFPVVVSLVLFAQLMIRSLRHPGFGGENSPSAKKLALIT